MFPYLDPNSSVIFLSPQKLSWSIRLLNFGVSLVLDYSVNPLDHVQVWADKGVFVWDGVYYMGAFEVERKKQILIGCKLI